MNLYDHQVHRGFYHIIVEWGKKVLAFVLKTFFFPIFLEKKQKKKDVVEF